MIHVTAQGPVAVQVDQFIDRLLPASFQVLNSTGQAGHCILVARVLDLVFKVIEIPSEPLCLDYEVANPPAVEHLDAGGSPHTLLGDAYIGGTGSGRSGMYDHHVVTLLPFDTTATILDLAIIQVARTIPGVEMSPVVLDLPFPLPRSRSFEVHGSRVTYSFLPGVDDFKQNGQWSDVESARYRAAKILRQIGLADAAAALE